MYWISKSIHWLSRLRRRTLILLAVLGPGIITMVADNDAGGISTYAQTGAKTGFSLLWAFIILVPMAYYVQEMTVRLGAVTKRGPRRGHFRWLRHLLGLVLHLRSGGDQLADPGDRIHRHDAGDEPVQHPRVGIVPGRDVPAVSDRGHGRVLDLRENHALLLPVQPGLYPRRHLGDADRQRGGRLEGGRQRLLPSQHFGHRPAGP